MEKAAEIKILSRKDPVPLDLLLRSNLDQQELSRMKINSLSLLDKTEPHKIDASFGWIVGEKSNWR